MNKQPILSLCIPTNGMVKWVIPTIKSIYCQGVDNTLFEIVITDNGPDDSLAKAIEQFNYPNIHYYKSEEKGFVNQITSFRLSNGTYIKMLNHRSCLKPMVLADMISFVQHYSTDKPILYFADGHASGSDIIECENTDKFVKAMSYWISWSAGVGLWDIDKPMLSKVSPNKMFPHMCLMFDVRSESGYVIWNKEFQNMQDESGKGGYDLFHTFAVVQNDIIKDLEDRGRISLPTYSFVKKQLYYFLCRLYLKEVINRSTTERAFILKDIKSSMCVYYGLKGYYWMIIRQYLAHFKTDILHL